MIALTLADFERGFVLVAQSLGLPLDASNSRRRENRATPRAARAPPLDRDTLATVRRALHLDIRLYEAVLNRSTAKAPPVDKGDSALSSALDRRIPARVL